MIFFVVVADQRMPIIERNVTSQDDATSKGIMSNI